RPGAGEIGCQSVRGGGKEEDRDEDQGTRDGHACRIAHLRRAWREGCRALPTHAMDRRDSGPASSRHVALFLMSALTLPALVGYLGSVLLLAESFLGVDVRLRHLAALILVSLAAGTGLAGLIAARAPRAVAAAINLQVALLTTCALMIAEDVAYALLENTRAPAAADPEYDRLHDANLLVGEFYPALYYPTGRNFRLHKPGQ